MPAAIIPAAIGAVGSIAGGAIGKQGAQSASSAQTAAAQQATQAQLEMYQSNAQNLAPYIQSGSVAQDTLMRAIPTLMQPYGQTFQNTDAYNPGQWNPTQEGLAQTPGYQFALQQGLLATQNGMAAKGLGQSGAALKGAGNYAEGLASETYQQNFDIYNQEYQNYLAKTQQNYGIYNQNYQNYLNQNSQIYNMLAQPAQAGEGAAAALAGVGTQTGGQIGNNLIGAGNAQGGAAIAGANAIGGGISTAGNNALQASLYSNLMGGGGYGYNLNNSVSDNTTGGYILGPLANSPSYPMA